MDLTLLASCMGIGEADWFPQIPVALHQASTAPQEKGPHSELSQLRTLSICLSPSSLPIFCLIQALGGELTIETLR